MNEDLLIVRRLDYVIYVLREGGDLYVLDPGFIGGRAALRKALVARGWDRHRLKGILVTHAHIDHILNVTDLAEETGAWVAAPRLDAPRIEGTYRYQGAARVCGALEALAKSFLRYQPFRVDHRIDDQTEFPIWGGLRAVHLPGHTEGHMGFLCPGRRLLFSADLFASFGPAAHLPPRIFNSQPELIPRSVERALSLNLSGVLPYHGDQAAPETHLERLKKLAVRLGIPPST